jgi:hypothetical protein
VTRSAGIELFLRGELIWFSMTPWSVCSFMPSRRAVANASSRSGPAVLVALARASA